MVNLGENDPPLSMASAVWSTLQNDSIQGGSAAGIQLDTPTETRTSKQLPPQSPNVPPESRHEIYLSTENETTHDDKETDHQSDPIEVFFVRDFAGRPYMVEGYISYHELENTGKLVVMASKSIIMVQKEDLRVQWELLLENVQTVIKDRTGLIFWLRRGIQGPYIPSGDQQSIDGLWQQVTVAVHAYNEEVFATKAQESDTRLVLGPMPQTSPDLRPDPRMGQQSSRSPATDSDTGPITRRTFHSPDAVLDTDSMVRQTYRGPYANGNSSDITLRPMASQFAGRRLPSPIQEGPSSSVDQSGLVKQDQDLETATVLLGTQGSLPHIVDQAERPQPIGGPKSRAKSLGHARRESIQARRARREQAQENVSLGEAAAQVEYTQSGSSQDTEIKPVLLKGLFSMSITSSKPLSVIRSDIIRVLDHFGVHWEQIKGGFKCLYRPDVDLTGETSLDKTEDLIFEMLIVKVPLRSLHGIHFRNVEGWVGQYRNMEQKILTKLRL
jgi:hypothetical protein